jgi:murein tripeptide amidase MpaA
MRHFFPVLLSLSTVICTVSAQDIVRFDGHAVVRVQTRTADEVEQIRNLESLLLSDSEGPGITDYLISPQQMPAFRALNLPFEMLDDNIQDDLDAERQRLAYKEMFDVRDPNWFFDYKSLEQVNAYLNTMAADRPDLATVLDIGASYENRRIYALRISGPGAGKPALLFDGAHHAREWITVMTVMYLADRLVYDYDTDPRIRSLVNQLEFYIIPVSNVDGYKYTWTTNRLWRKNRRINAGSSCIGVDTNRNYSVGWGGSGSSSDPCNDTYRGASAFSEPETKVLRDFYLAHPNIVASVSFHSYAELIMSPYGYTAALPADNELFMEADKGMHDAIYATHAHNYGYGPINSTIYPASGSTVDWAYDVAKAYAFTIEERDTGTYGFVLPPSQIIPTAEENAAAALYLGDWVAQPVKFDFPQGLPARVESGTATPLQVRVKTLHGTLNENALLLYASLNGGEFSTTTLTPLGGGLYQALLPAVRCGETLSYYFVGQNTAGFGGRSPAAAPDVYTAAAQPVRVLLDATMDTNPGWATTGLWSWGRPTGGGTNSKDPNSGYTGLNVYGYNLAGDYEANLTSERTLTVGPIDCTGVTQTRLVYYRWLGVEQPAYDQAALKISTNGTTFSQVWINPTALADRAWVRQEFDLSSWADNKPAVWLRWTMGPTDSNTQYAGWNIDDVLLSAVGPCTARTGDLNCDGQVDFRDINPFVLSLADPAAYGQAFPTCSFLNGDTNGDQQVDFRDINPFVTLLSGSS